METHNAANLCLMTKFALTFAEANASWDAHHIIGLTLHCVTAAGRQMVVWLERSLLEFDGRLVVPIPLEWRSVFNTGPDAVIGSYSDFASVHGSFDSDAQRKAAFKVVGGPQLMVLLTLIPGVQRIYLRALVAAPFLATCPLLAFHIMKQSPSLIGATTFSYHLDDETEQSTKWTLVVKLTPGVSASQVQSSPVQRWSRCRFAGSEHSTKTDGCEPYTLSNRRCKSTGASRSSTAAAPATASSAPSSVRDATTNPFPRRTSSGRWSSSLAEGNTKKNKKQNGHPGAVPASLLDAAHQVRETSICVLFAPESWSKQNQKPQKP